MPNAGHAQYVIQRHTHAGMEHYDFMFEVAGQEKLRTFQLPEPPSEATVARGTVCRELAPHRRIYLEYEGPVSRDRGHVQIWDRGRLAILEATPNLIRLRPESARGIRHREWVMHRTGAATWYILSPFARHR